jgi:hypothetical protein
MGVPRNDDAIWYLFLIMFILLMCACAICKSDAADEGYTSESSEE